MLGPFLLATFATSFLLVWRRFPHLHSAKYFALSYGSLSLALTLDWTREVFDPVVASYLTNIPYLSAVAFYAAGVFAFSNRAVPWRALAGLLLIIIIAMVWFRHISPSLVWRTVTMTFGVSVIMLFGVISNFPHTKTKLKRLFSGRSHQFRSYRWREQSSHSWPKLIA